MHFYEYWKSDTHDLFRGFFFCIILLVSLFLTRSILNIVYGDDTLSLPQLICVIRVGKICVFST